MDNYEVRIWQDYQTNSVKIIFLDRTHKDNRVINFYTSEVRILKDFEQIPDEFMLKIPSFIAQEVLQVLAEALDKRGIKTDKDAKIQGTLEATKYHLEDLRKLLKLDKHIK